jgi:hypothetical protein
MNLFYKLLDFSVLWVRSFIICDLLSLFIKIALYVVD